MNYPKWMTSSVNANRMSLAVRGALVGIAPIAMLLLGLTQDEVNSIVDAIVNVVFYGATLYSCVGIVVGLVRKLIAGRWSAE